MFAPMRGNTIRLREVFPVRQQEKCMNKSAIRLLMLVMFAMTSLAVPMVVPAKAATDGSTPAKKKHKKMNSTSGQMQAPMTSSQSPPNMADDPSRRVSY
jgi:hypothetical protein